MVAADGDFFYDFLRTETIRAILAESHTVPEDFATHSFRKTGLTKLCSGSSAGATGQAAKNRADWADVRKRVLWATATASKILVVIRWCAAGLLGGTTSIATNSACFLHTFGLRKSREL